MTRNPHFEAPHDVLDEFSIPAPAAYPDSAAVDGIYLEHAPLLRRIAIRKFRIPPCEAEALVHDVFLNYLIRAKHVRGEVRGYLIAGICNASRNYWRSQKTESRVFSDDQVAEIEAGGEDVSDGLAVNLAVATVLARLGARCREVLRRYYLEGEETGVIAASMETSAANVNYMMHVCRKRARAIYETITRVGR